MGYKILTPEQDNWLKENAHQPHSHLSKHLGISVHTVATKLRRWGFTRTKEQMEANIRIVKPYTKLTPEDYQWLKENSHLSVAVLAEKLNVSVSNIRQKFKRLGIKRTREQINENRKQASLTGKYPVIYDSIDRRNRPSRFILHGPGLREKYINYLWRKSGRALKKSYHLWPIDGDHFNFDLKNWKVKVNGTKKSTPAPVKKKIVVKAAPPPKPEVSKYKTIKRDYSKLKTVRVDAKTIIYIDPNECPEKAIEAYKARINTLTKKIRNVR